MRWKIFRYNLKKTKGNLYIFGKENEIRKIKTSYVTVSRCPLFHKHRSDVFKGLAKQHLNHIQTKQYIIEAEKSGGVGLVADPPWMLFDHYSSFYQSSLIRLLLLLPPPPLTVAIRCHSKSITKLCVRIVPTSSSTIFQSSSTLTSSRSPTWSSSLTETRRSRTEPSFARYFFRLHSKSSLIFQLIGFLFFRHLIFVIALSDRCIEFPQVFSDLGFVKRLPFGVSQRRCLPLFVTSFTT